MPWRIEFERRAARELKALDPAIARRITRKLTQVAERDDPRSLGEPLGSNLVGLWKYREGSYRIIASIEDNRLLVLRIGHRKEVYC